MSGQVDPGQPQSSEALDTYLAEVTANVPTGMKTTQDDAPWQYTTLHAPEIADAVGIPAMQLRSKAKGAFLRSAMDGSQIRTIVDRLTSDDYEEDEEHLTWSRTFFFARWTVLGAGWRRGLGRA